MTDKEIIAMIKDHCDHGGILIWKNTVNANYLRVTKSPWWNKNNPTYCISYHSEEKQKNGAIIDEITECENGLSGEQVVHSIECWFKKGCEL